MILTIDAGNTNIVFALFEEISGADEPTHVWRIETDTSKKAHEYAAWLNASLQENGLSSADITRAVLSSVVPDMNMIILASCAQLSVSCRVLTTQDFEIDVLLDKPDEIGIDRLVNAEFVIGAGDAPAIIIDFGTATTFDVINENGAYCGGAIAPGVQLSAKILHEATAKLPHIEIARAEKIIGTDTKSAMQSGLYFGYIAMVEGMIEKITQEMGATQKPMVIATGGLCKLYAQGTDLIDKTDVHLTLKGLKDMCDK